MADDKEPEKKRGRGRPRVAPEDSKARPPHMIKAFDNEFALVKRFNRLTRTHPEECEKILEALENWKGGVQE